MFRLLAIILLLAALSAQTFHQALIVLDYYTNPAPFAARCINKAAPKLKCKGKCQVAKKLQAEEQKDQHAPGRSVNYTVDICSSDSFFAVVLPLGREGERMPRPVTSALLPAPLKGAVFHPPATL